MKIIRTARSQYQKVEIPPITLAECVSKVTVGPDTPNDTIKQLESFKLNAVVLLSKREWSPNPHMEEYQRRKERKRRERELA